MINLFAGDNLKFPPNYFLRVIKLGIQGLKVPLI